MVRESQIMRANARSRAAAPSLGTAAACLRSIFCDDTVAKLVRCVGDSQVANQQRYSETNSRSESDWHMQPQAQALPHQPNVLHALHPPPCDCPGPQQLSAAVAADIERRKKGIGSRCPGMAVFVCSLAFCLPNTPSFALSSQNLPSPLLKFIYYLLIYMKQAVLSRTPSDFTPRTGAPSSAIFIVISIAIA